MLTILLLQLFFLACNPIVLGFDFNVTSPAQCDSVRFTWTGGQPPFSALVIPSGGTLKNISIPSNAFNGHSGDFSTQLALVEDTWTAFSMGDATGATTGGVTQLMMVGPPRTGQTCNTTDPGVDFYFSLDGVLAQCKSYPFTNYANAIQPITILVTVPGGESFYLHPPIGDSFDWHANITAGTSVLFTMTDSRNRAGGTPTVRVAASSDDSSCIQHVPTSSTRTASSTSTATSPADTSRHSGGHADVSAIIGGVVGGLTGLGLLFALFLFWRHRKAARNHQRSVLDLTYDPRDDVSLQPFPKPFPPASYTSYHDSSPRNTIDPSSPDYITAFPHDPAYTTSSSGSRKTLLHMPPESEGRTEAREHLYQSITPQNPFADGPPHHRESSSSYSMPRPRETSVTGSSKRTLSTGPQVIVHADIEDVEELPPQYSESRMPIPGMSSPVPYQY